MQLLDFLIESYLFCRHVTKCTAIQETFTNFLTAHIISKINEPDTIDTTVDYSKFEYYSERVPKVMMCIENFPCGELAVESVGVDLLTRSLFFNYFSHCRRELRYGLFLFSRLILSYIFKIDVY